MKIPKSAAQKLNQHQICFSQVFENPKDNLYFKLMLSYFMFEIGVCKCRKGCTFLSSFLSCFPLYEQGPCQENQAVTDSGDGLTGICTCNSKSILIENYEGCYSLFSEGPCPFGQEVQLKNKVGLCFVCYLLFLKLLY